MGLAARQIQSQKIKERLLVLDAFSRAKTVHFYLADPFEVETDGMIREALSLGKKVVVPTRASLPCSLSEITDFDPAYFQIAPSGIREPLPEFCRDISPDKVDLWIIPGVAYDIMGGRLGRGAGYFDQQLAGVSRPIIGLGFEFQVLDTLPLEPTDRRVDQIITEKRTLFCRS
jgi:5-formyltetrahydrofolate cyclo-ligase